MPRVAAFFDMDRTLLRCNTGTRWIAHARRTGMLSTWKAIRAAGWLAQYKLAILDMEAVTAIAAADVRGDSVADTERMVRAWFEREIAREIAPAARVAVERHR